MTGPTQAQNAAGGKAPATDDKAEEVVFITHPMGVQAFKKACMDLTMIGIPLAGDPDEISIDSFKEAARAIMVASDISWACTAELQEAREALAAITECFRSDFSAPTGQATATPFRTSPPTALGTTEMTEMGEDAPSTPAQETVGSIRGGSSSTASGANTGRKRIREEHAADRASDALLAGAHSSHAGILAGKPLDVVLYTPHLLRLYKAARAAIRATSRLAGHLITFEGDLADVDDAAFEAAPLAPLLSCATGVTPSADPVLAAERVSLFAALDECRTTLVHRSLWAV